MTKIIWKLIQIKRLKSSYHLSKEWKKKVQKARTRLQDIISGKSPRKILIIWPCSADFEESLYKYADFLKWLKEKYSDKLEIVMRFYTGKPRTVWWWKGILHSAPDKEPNLKNGIKEARKIAINLIEKYDMSLADELLYPELSSRLWDLYSYMAVWARSSENQFHREVASGLLFPVWIKNPTSWDLKIMTNSIKASQNPSIYVLERTIYQTPWNSFTHAILRGWGNWPNYDIKYIEETYNLLQKTEIKNPSLIIDCNHDNSKKKYEIQIKIMKEVMKNLWDYKSFVKWFMVESYLFDDRQEISNAIKKWQSLTDPCIWLDKTEELVKELYNSL